MPNLRRMLDSRVTPSDLSFSECRRQRIWVQNDKEQISRVSGDAQPRCPACAGGLRVRVTLLVRSELFGVQAPSHLDEKRDDTDTVRTHEKTYSSDFRFRRKLSGTTAHCLLGTQRPYMLCGSMGLVLPNYRVCGHGTAQWSVGGCI